MNSQDAFKQNLPQFVVQSVRGNVVADSENFTANSGTEFQSFKIAHTFRKDGVTAFIKVLLEEGTDPVSKGDYVDVCGDYLEAENTGNDGTVYLNRTIFASSVSVLGRKEAPKTKTTKKTTKKGK